MGAIQQVLLGYGAVGGGGGTDPFFANVVSLMHFDGTDGSSTITDVIGKTWTTTGTAVLRTAQKQFGASSLEMESSAQNRIDCPSTDFNFGTGDYTIEGWFRPDSSTNRAFFSFGSRLVYTASGNWAYFNGSGNQIVGGVAASNTWVHVALCRASGDTRLFIGGTQVGSTYAGESATAINPGAMRLGYYNAGNPSGRYYDEFRVTNGVGRYTSNFTPAGPFPDS